MFIFQSPFGLPIDRDYSNPNIHIAMYIGEQLLKCGLEEEEACKAIALDKEYPARIRQAALKQYLNLKLGAK